MVVCNKPVAAKFDPGMRCGGVCLGPVGCNLQFAGELVSVSYYGDLGHHI